MVLPMTVRMRFWGAMPPALAWALSLLTACGGDKGSKSLVCGEGTSAALAADATVAVTDGAGKDLRHAAVAADSKTSSSWTVGIACADDIQPSAHTALGVAVAFTPAAGESRISDRPLRFTLPFKAARFSNAAGVRHIRIAAKHENGEVFFPPVTDALFDTSDAYASTVTFSSDFFATYQVVLPEDAGKPVTRRFTYKSMLGISMGGNAAMAVGLRHHDRFDMIADLGGEPGPNMPYTLGVIRDFILGSACPSSPTEGPLAAPQHIPSCVTRPPLADQHEIISDYDHMTYQEGEGVGLRLRRGFYAMALRDMARAFGNLALYNVADSYAPPGVNPDYFQLTYQERCVAPVVLADFYDARFNPTGALPVISYCDGGDNEATGFGVWNDTELQDEPMEILLAVDLNENGVRDGGEPVLIQMHEPFDDIGTDGKADQDEPGYDAATNPDPAGDNYHYLRNPGGSENNRWYDSGEPFDDVGVDGVADTCQQGDTPPNGVAGCYDWGQGDGVWSVTPSAQGWLDNGIGASLDAMTEAERSRVDFWHDAGIRDFFNASISANAGFSQLMNQFGRTGRVFTSFQSLAQTPQGQSYDFGSVHWPAVGRNVYVRYGNPDATETEIHNGDGRHVGSVTQIVARVTTAFAWINANWPNGDRDDEYTSGQLFDDLSFTTSAGRETPFALFLPPGYDNPANANRRYPVVVFLHGYGQEPNDMVTLSAVFESYMQPTGLPPDQRFQKFIIVYADGRCRPQRDGVPVNLEGDLCESGNFYLNLPIPGAAQMEDALMELLDHVDANYRTKAPEEVTFVP